MKAPRNPGKSALAPSAPLCADRIAQFQAQVAHLRNTETNPVNYRAAVSGFLTEIDRMQLDVREYLNLHPREVTAAA